MKGSESRLQTTIVATDAIPHSMQNDLGFPALSCQIPSSSLTCLVGPHRSQLRDYLQMLAAIKKPLQGQVTILGQSVSELDQVAWGKLRGQIGYLSGNAPLLSAQHGLMNVMLPLLYQNDFSFREASNKARAFLTELNCDFDPTLYPAMLNGFQRAQLGLARALIRDPEILFLDVPFNDLGAKEREKMGGLLEIYKENRTICMIGGLQYPHFLEQQVKQIIFISESKVMIFNSWLSFIQSNDSEVQKLLSVL